MVATLPYNHIFGPVHRVSFHQEDGIWQLLVLVTSIFCDQVGGEKLKVWVTVSHGTTQWARWQTYTGDPEKPENRPVPPPSDFSLAWSDLGCKQAETPRGLARDGSNGLEQWQDDITIYRTISKEQRYWTILPCSGRDDFKPWLLKFALQTLRRKLARLIRRRPEFHQILRHCHEESVEP